VQNSTGVCAFTRDCNSPKSQSFSLFGARGTGMTGLWQATARDTRDGLVKFQMDAAYVHRRSFRLDLYLWPKTLVTVARGIGAD